AFHVTGVQTCALPILFTNLRFEQLLDTLGMIADVDLHAPLEAWYHPTALPNYILWSPEVIQITNRDKEVYVLRQLVTNDSDNDRSEERRVGKEWRAAA